MKKIIVASKNPVKIAAALNGFRAMFPDEEFSCEGVSAPSGVGDQPQNDADTLRGALNRAENVSKMAEADFWLGIEGGIEDKEGSMEAFAWIVTKAKNGKIGKGRTGTFFLPPQVAELVRQGKELGEADDIVFQRTNSKQENGAVGLLTGNVIDRTRYYESAVIMSLIPFKNAGLY